MNNIARAAFVFLIIVYTSGVIGMWLRPQMFIPYTPAVLLMFALYFIYVHRRLSSRFFLALAVMGALSYAIEVLGVTTAWAFGTYHYGTAFGPKAAGVPLCISLNWILVLCACWGFWSFWKMPFVLQSLLTALLCTFIDILMESLAPHFNWWFFLGGYAGIYNYLCWFLWSFTLALIFKSTLMKVKHPIAMQWIILNGLYFLILNLKFVTL